jgi:magnesium and cobalt transporter
MKEEPPSISAHPEKLGLIQRIKNFFRDFHIRISFKPSNQEELTSVLRDAEENNLIDKGVLDMMEETIDFSSTPVKEVMVPKTQVISIKETEGLAEFLPRILESAHSRFPVFDEPQEKIKGILLAKDLLKFGPGLLGQDENINFDLSQILRPINFIPESKKINILLEEFKTNRSHMAAVVDEFGEISGIVTIEDVLEEIVGEIVDETDISESEDIIQLTENEFNVSALTEIETFNDRFSSSFEATDFDTIGGIVLNAFGKIPLVNDSIEIQNFHFTVLAANKRQILKLRIKVLESSSEELN